ncbi:acyl-CoA dehydrogenase [Nakamurella aerolata]|uniref:Acyl-CoA dehydrogenase n=1 Tax=Nakamurella aerolata TaxID=1656892 RepID=A0A849AG19_9ACTN|nr:acyl-CoA dehydrogenase [Nakamurella aerolata]NNG35772.1 acyl-CoA dehydrogenase [Nakamurella aerolata]
MQDPASELAAEAVERAEAAVSSDDRVGATLCWLPELGRRAATPGSGRTLQLWDVLARLASVDLVVARTVEPHLDAVAILGQLPEPAQLDPIGVGTDTTWGVYAAEGPGQRVTARDHDGTVLLDGSKPWCSLAGRLSHALVTAWTDDTTRGLFAVPLRHAGVRVEAADNWVARGMADLPSVGVELDGVPAVPIGGPGWYLRRPGFWWGGVGVAACWYGGAVGVAQRLAPRPGREPDQLRQLQIGAVDVALFAARTALQRAASEIDQQASGTGQQATDLDRLAADNDRLAAANDPTAGTDGGPRDSARGGEMQARRVRTLVRRAADEVLERTSRETGPGPLATDERHARRVADLHLYLRQDHGERDEAGLGRLLTDAVSAG